MEGASRPSATSTQNKNMKILKSVHGRKIYSLDGGKTLHMQARGQVTEAAIPIDKPNYTKAKRGRPKGSLNKFTSSRKFTTTKRVSIKKQNQKVYKYNRFAAQSPASDSHTPPSIVMVSEGTEEESHCLQFDEHQNIESVVVESLSDMGLSMDEEDAITLNLLENCTVDTPPAEHIIDEQYVHTGAMKIQSMMDDNQSQQRIVNQHVIVERELTADHLNSDNQDPDDSSQYFQEENPLNEPECQLVIKKEILSQDEEVENNITFHHSENDATIYPSVKIKEEPVHKDSFMDHEDNDDHADPEQLIRLYVNNSGHLVDGLNDQDSLPISSLQYLDQQPMTQEIHKPINKAPIRSVAPSVTGGVLRPRLMWTASVAPSTQVHLQSGQSMANTTTVAVQTSAPSTPFTVVKGSGGKGVELLPVVPHGAENKSLMLNENNNTVVAMPSMMKDQEQSLMDVTVGEEGVAPASKVKKADVSVKYKERKAARASGGKKVAKSGQTYVKVDKEDPRSRLHFVKYMKKEMKTVKVWECGICGREFIHQYTLMRHLPTHTDERNFQCQECGKAFRQMSTLSQHRATHSKSRPYVCDVCKKTFNRVSTLISHKKIHEEKKQHICDVCGKAFHQKGNLKNHMFIHTNERPYKCHQCGRGFNQASNLHSHRIRAHSDNSMDMRLGAFSGQNSRPIHPAPPKPQQHSSVRLSCSYCPMTFSSKAALKKHETAMHANLRDLFPKPGSIVPSAGGVVMCSAVAGGGSSPKRRKIGSVRIMQLPDGEETYHELMQDCKGSGQIHYRQVADDDLSADGDATDAPSASLPIPAITTNALTAVLAAGGTPFALLKPAASDPVVVKVEVVSSKQQRLVPATAAELRAASQFSVSGRGGGSKALQIKIPIVATVIQKLSADGEPSIDILPPEDEHPAITRQAMATKDRTNNSAGMFIKSKTGTGDRSTPKKSSRKYSGSDPCNTMQLATTTPDANTMIASFGNVLTFSLNNTDAINTLSFGNGSGDLTYLDVASTSSQNTLSLVRSPSTPKSKSSLNSGQVNVRTFEGQHRNSPSSRLGTSTNSSGSNINLLSNVRASINTIRTGSRSSPLVNNTLSPLMSNASSSAAGSLVVGGQSSTNTSTGALSSSFLPVVSSSVEASDLPSGVLPRGTVLSLESDISESVSESVLEGDEMSVGSGLSGMSNLLSSSVTADHDDVGSSTAGLSLVTYANSGDNNSAAVALEGYGAGDSMSTVDLMVDHHQQLQESELSELRYLSATGAPGEFEMVAPDDPRLTHIVNEFGQLQEVQLQTNSDVTAMEHISIEDSDNGNMDSKVGVMDGDGHVVADGANRTNSSSALSSAVSVDGGTALTIGGVDHPSGSITIAGGSGTDSITLTETGGLTIECGSGTVTVGEGGTVAVENIAALIGALQRAGVPVQLHQPGQVVVQEEHGQHQLTMVQDHEHLGVVVQQQEHVSLEQCDETSTLMSEGEGDGSIMTEQAFHSVD